MNFPVEPVNVFGSVGCQAPVYNKHTPFLGARPMSDSFCLFKFQKEACYDPSTSKITNCLFETYDIQIDFNIE